MKGTPLTEEQLKRLNIDTDILVWIPQRNKWRDDTAKEILEKMFDIEDEIREKYWSEINNRLPQYLISYIKKEILCLSDNK